MIIYVLIHVTISIPKYRILLSFFFVPFYKTPLKFLSAFVIFPTNIPPIMLHLSQQGVIHTPMQTLSSSLS